MSLSSRRPPVSPAGLSFLSRQSTWFKLKRYNGHTENELADKLATEAIDRYRRGI
jgi:hypothetical protein